MYIIGFNGPPRAGKDTLAAMVADHLCQKTNLPVLTIPLSMPMRKMAMGAIGVEYQLDTYERIKDQPIAALKGMLLRQFMIDISESYMKPTQGQEIWSELLCESIPLDFQGILLVPDFGFQHEPDFFERRFDSSRVCAVQVHREGKDFNGDSRGWVHSTHTYKVHNDGSLDDLKTEAVRIYGRLVNQMGWRL